MELFSKLTKKSKNGKEDEIKYDGYLKVLDSDGWEYVEEKDCVVVIPHLVNFDEILLRKEVVPPFNSRIPDQEHFITVVSGTMEGTEKPEETLVRELREETGIKLNTGFQGWKKWGSFFWNKGNNSRCHLFYLPLTISDFQKVSITGDGSEFEKKSTTFRIDIKYLDSLKPSDLITQTMLLYLKKELE